MCGLSRNSLYDRRTDVQFTFIESWLVTFFDSLWNSYYDLGAWSLRNGNFDLSWYSDKRFVFWRFILKLFAKSTWKVD